METFKRILFSNWGILRILRLIIGIMLLAQAYLIKDGLLGILSAVVLYQVLTNTGCCGMSSCESRNCDLPK